MKATEICMYMCLIGLFLPGIDRSSEGGVSEVSPAGVFLTAAEEASAKPEISETAFDPVRYIDVDQIKPGMRGIGQTVFQGTQVEEFDVVVVSVMKNADPKRDSILIRCEDERFDLGKGVRGVSGSPVYFDGKLAGAMAFVLGEFGAEPLYGVTPIREMLKVQRSAGKKGDQDDNQAVRRASFKPQLYREMMRDELLDKDQIEWLVRKSGLGRGRDSSVAGELTTLPLSLSVSGMSGEALECLSEWLPGLEVSTGLSGGNIVEQWRGKLKPEPGGTLVIPLIMGDMYGSVLGTITEVAGDKVYGFGHSYNGEGAAMWPMGTGYIHAFFNSLRISNKVGQLVEVVGAIQADESTAVYGRIGATAPMADMRVSVTWPGETAAEIFEVKIARDEVMDPVLAMTVVANALLQRGEMLPRDHTIHYRAQMNFAGAESISYENISSQRGVVEIMQDVLSPLGLMLNNPWQREQLISMEVEATIEDRARSYEVKSVQMDGRIFHPGQTVKAVVEIEGLYEKPRQVEVSLPLPEDLEPGKYKINVESDMYYRRDLQQARPHRYMAFDSEDVQRVLQERLSISRGGLYMTMMIPRPGLAIEDDELPYLPGSRTMLLTDTSRRVTASQFQPLLVSSTEIDGLVVGRGMFEIEVREK